MEAHFSICTYIEAFTKVVDIYAHIWNLNFICAYMHLSTLHNACIISTFLAYRSGYKHSQFIFDNNQYQQNHIKFPTIYLGLIKHRLSTISTFKVCY